MGKVRQAKDGEGRIYTVVEDRGQVLRLRRPDGIQFWDVAIYYTVGEGL